MTEKDDKAKHPYDEEFKRYCEKIRFKGLKERVENNAKIKEPYPQGFDVVIYYPELNDAEGDINDCQ
jgi:hypothetical protein